MSSISPIFTKLAPEPVGPYSQAIKAGNFIFCSGQIAINPKTNTIDCLGNIEKETTQVIENLNAVLKTANADLSNVIKTTIFLTDLNNFKVVNSIYEKYFKGKNSPARACVEVSSLPKDVLIEIDCVAYIH